jgi:hypothetical protein
MKYVGKYLDLTERGDNVRCYIKNVVVYTGRLPGIVRAVKFRRI